MSEADDHTCMRLLLVENTVTSDMSIMVHLFILFKMLLGCYMNESYNILQ